MNNFTEELNKALWNDYLRRMYYLHYGTYMKGAIKWEK